MGVIFTMTTAFNSIPEMFPRRNSRASAPVLGVGDKIGEGDTYLVENVLPRELAEVAFEKLMKEVAWNVMHHASSRFVDPSISSFSPHATHDTDT